MLVWGVSGGAQEGEGVLEGFDDFDVYKSGI